MKITHVIFLFSILLLTGCSEDNETDVIFHVSVSDIKAYSATVTITHNGTNRDVYYGFVTEGNTNDIQSAISRFQSTASNQDFLQAAHSQRKCVFKITGLAQNHTYTFIVYGTDESGNLHGKPSAFKFTTDKSDFTASVNPNWKIEYKGHTVYNNYDYSLITVNLIGNMEERFFLATYEASIHDSFSCIEDFIYHATDQFVNPKQENTNGNFWIDDSQVRKEGTNFYRYLVEGNYVSYAIGINADGSPTGHYVKTAYHVDKYPAVEGYSNLLGDWVIIDEQDKIFFVTFREKLINISLTMTGWGNWKQFPITVSFDRNTASLHIQSQKIDDNATVNFTEGSQKGALYLQGIYYDKNGKLMRKLDNYTVTKAQINSTGDEYIFSPGFSVSSSGGWKATSRGMAFVLEKDKDNAISFAQIMFPFIMKKKDSL